MKQITLILTFIIWTVKAFADCDGVGIYFWPSGQTIKQNSIIVIDGYAESQNVIIGLNKKYPIYLKTGDKKVKLTVKEILVGEFYLTQAVLTVDETLEVGKNYEIFIDSLPEYERPLQKWNNKTRKYEHAIWTVIEGIDTIQPIWNVKPVETEKTLIHYGCGPEKYVHFKFKIDDESEFLIKATVTNRTTKKITSYYLETDGSSLLIGHGMCSGAFLFEEGNEYDILFNIMDASGNLTLWTDKKIIFTKPIDENNIDE